ncbi:hypothetical protein EVAR_79654_1 [Eumeta japonica]|uniref:Uncharacterized protein n=1 Tax=Eumeta variegata TaxID=151549 RepID=A0A4C1WCF5_EUMVA|nr:hypothetical protein EVAR_79654_1 [Eumeta japonica]
MQFTMHLPLQRVIKLHAMPAVEEWMRTASCRLPVAVDLSTIFPDRRSAQNNVSRQMLKEVQRSRRATDGHHRCPAPRAAPVVTA